MKRKNRILIAACTAAVLTVTSAAAVFAADAEPAKSSIEDMTASEYGVINSAGIDREEHDKGHIYVGVAITDGAVDEANSNWADRAV